jgi:hypothetical protein
MIFSFSVLHSMVVSSHSSCFFIFGWGFEPYLFLGGFRDYLFDLRWQTQHIALHILISTGTLSLESRVIGAFLLFAWEGLKLTYQSNDGL